MLMILLRVFENKWNLNLVGAYVKTKADHFLFSVHILSTELKLHLGFSINLAKETAIVI